jgi:hypothetical protein
LPNRIIKESICTSDSIDGLSWFEECFFYRLIVNCDDYGRMDARPAILRARLFPLKSVTDKQIEAALQSLRTAAMIDLYVVDGRSYLQLRTWERHQQIRAKKSKYPAPDEACNQMISDDIKCSRNPIQSESNPNPNPNTKVVADKPPRSRFVPPTLDEVTAYCKERNNNVDPEQFISYYESNGWRVGKNPMKDWKAAVITWERRESKTTPKPARQSGLNKRPNTISHDSVPDEEDLAQLQRFLSKLKGAGADE